MVFGPQVQFALREWKTHLATPLPLTILTGVSLVLALTGPFGTHANLNLLERAGYWAIIAFGSYALGDLIGRLCDLWIGTRHKALYILISGTLIGLGVCMIVLALTAILFGLHLQSGADWTNLASLNVTIVAISIIIVAVLTFARDHASGVPDIQSEHQPPPLLKRIALEKRAPLVSLTVEDHYVRIQTLKGHELVLMRLSDAIKEVGETAGAQVHRSHWASFEQVTAVEKDGARTILQMRAGTPIPVSRANLPKLKKAGLTPMKPHD
jgi:hypothetical protein